MRKHGDPWELAARLFQRSQCRVKMAAVVTDKRGRLISWGWNHAGPDGNGLCAERHALGRANPKRLAGASIYIRGSNRRNEATSKPCNRCYAALQKAAIDIIVFRNTRKERTVRLLTAI